MIHGTKPRSRGIIAALHSVQITGLLEEKNLFLIVVSTSNRNRRRSALEGGLSIKMGTTYGCIKRTFLMILFLR